MTIPTLAGVLIACSISFSVCVKAADEPKSEAAPSAAANVSAPAPASATNSAATVATPTPAPVNPRLAVIDRIGKAALKAMAVSDDPIALVLSAKYVRDADMKDSEKRDEAKMDALQAAMMMRAKQLADKSNKGFVDFQIAMFCLGLPDKPVCSSDAGAGDAVRAYAESDPSNITGWIIMAAREYASSNTDAATAFLKKAAAGKTSNWFYQDAVGLTFKYAKNVNEPLAKIGDPESASFIISGAITLPPYKRLSQMCAPNSEGILPVGRYAACHKIAARLVSKGVSNLEVLVGYKIQERLALGKKNTKLAQSSASNYESTQAAIDYLWKTKMKFPPETDKNGEQLTKYFANFMAYGEAGATRMALKSQGKQIADFRVK